MDGDGSGVNPEGGSTVGVSIPGVSFHRLEGAATPLEFSLSRDKSGELITLSLTKVRGDEVGVVNTFSTQGAYCMQDDRPAQKSFASPKESGGEPTQIVAEAYSPRAGPASSQEIALKYNYFVKAEPIEVPCTFDVTRLRKYSHNAGSGGFLFWRKSWSRSELKEVRDNGVDCRTQARPGLGFAEEERNRIAEIEQKLAQEVMAEYIVQFAKSWTVTATQPAKVPGKTWDAVGPQMKLLCGANVHCQIGGLVWKSAEELFDSRQATTANRASLTGKIVRRYAEDGYRIDQGATTFKLHVNFPR